MIRGGALTAERPARQSGKHPRPKLDRPRVREAVALAVVACVAFAPEGNAAARAPSGAERAAIRQAIFDDIAANAKPARPLITHIRVSSITLGARPTGPHRYRKFARVDLSRVCAGALLGYYVASIPGWKVLDLGSSEVGCTPRPNVFQGKQRAILRDLKLDCP